MGKSKVVYAGQTLIDLTADTVAPETMVVGTVAHDASGEPIVGTNPYEKTATDAEVTEQADLIAQIALVLQEKASAGGSFDPNTDMVSTTQEEYDALPEIDESKYYFCIDRNVVQRVYLGAKLLYEKPSRLPTGYREVQYISFTGSQYVYLGLYPTQNTKLEIKFMATDNAGAWSSNSGSGVSNNFTGYAGSGNNNFRFGNKTVSFATGLDEDRVIVQSKDGIYLDGVQKSDYAGANNFTSTNEFRVGYNTSYYKGRVYYFAMWEDDAPLRDCLPCVREEDDVAGFYDLVNGVFYESSTSTALVAGPDAA